MLECGFDTYSAYIYICIYTNVYIHILLFGIHAIFMFFMIDIFIYKKIWLVAAYLPYKISVGGVKDY